MAAGEKKVSAMTFLADVPDDAKIYVVKPGVTTPYYTTKAALLAGISAGTTPNFQEVTDGAGNNETTNSVKFVLDADNHIEIDSSNQAVIFWRKISGVWTTIGGFSADTIQLGIDNFGFENTISFSNGSNSITITVVNDQYVISPNGITIVQGGVLVGTYAFPSGPSSPFATLADIPTINENYKGSYTSLSALETAHPTAALGDYATVDSGAGNDAVQYIWDAQDGWVASGSASPATTDALPEGTVNLYFTTARVLDSILTGLSLSDGSDVTAANSILVAIGKLQKQLTDVRAAKADKVPFMRQRNAYSLNSGTTGLQKLFNVGSGENGAFPASANKLYKFSAEIDITGLSSTSGAISFGFLGTATIASIRFTSNASKASLSTVSSAQIVSSNTASATAIVSPSTATSAKMIVRGLIEVSGAGTLIPSGALAIASAAQVEPNSWFDIYEVGADTVTASSTIT